MAAAPGPAPPAPPWEVKVDGKKALQQLLDRHFTRPRPKMALLPYHSQLDQYLDKWLQHLELGIVSAVLVHEQMPALRNYLNFLEVYIDRCGLRFTKEQHVRIIRLVYLIFTKENQWKEIVSPAGKLLVSLIDGSRLTFEDLVLDWRPVFRLYHGTVYGKLKYLQGAEISIAVYKLKRFYALADIATIWDELQVYISPRYRMEQFCDLCFRFLPVHMTGQEQRAYGAGLWWTTLWRLYEMVENGSLWGDQLPSLFSSMWRFAPDFMDLSPLYEDIFTRVLRAMGLSMRKGRVVASGSSSLSNMASWIGDLLGGPKSAQPQLTRLMKCMEVYLHPSNNGEHTIYILEFMRDLAERIRERIYHERVKTHKRKVPVDYYLQDDDLEQFVRCMLQPTLVALFNEDTEESTMACAVLRVLAALEPGIVLPKYLDHTYNALHAVCEPHRLVHTLTCLVGVVFQLAADHNSRLKNVPVENLPEQINLIREMSARRRLSVKEKQWLQQNQQLLSLRHHLIHLLEALIVAVDINDVVKTILSLHNIVLIYYVIPNVDASECVQHHADLTEDEKRLCELTKKLPDLADMLFDKLLRTIQSMAICAPRNSTELLGSLNDGQTDTGVEEQEMIRMANKVVAVTLFNSSPAIAAALVEKIYKFITSNEFESQLSTAMSTGILQETVLSRPETLPRFAAFVLKNLKAILTPEMRLQKELNHTALWFVNLASALFSASSQAFIANKDICFEIIAILCDCHCKFAHDTGTSALWSALFMLTRTYTRNEERVKLQLSRPLTDWVPVREWAKTYQEHEVDLTWHVPDEQRRLAAEELVQRLVFPLFDRLLEPQADQHSLRRHMSQLYYGFVGAYNYFPLPQSCHHGPTLNPLPTSLPRVKIGPSGTPLKYGEIVHPSGRNVRELMVETCEKVVERMTTNGSKLEDPQTLCTVSNLLKMVVKETLIDGGQYRHSTRECLEVFSLLNSPLDYGRRIGGDAMDAYVSALHYHMICAEQNLPYTAYQQRIFGTLFKLAVNDYPEVRATAQTDMLYLLGDYLRGREELVNKTAAILRDDKSRDQQLKGVFSLIIANDWPASCKDEERSVLWKALIEMKMVEWLEMTESVEEIWRQIGNITTPKRPEQKDGELEEVCRKMWAENKKDGVWTGLSRLEDLEAAKKKNAAYRESRKKSQQELVGWLLEKTRNREMHHTRQKLVRTMLWRSQREKAGAETIKVLLSKMIDEEEYLRDRSADELAFWLKENKPKTARTDWTCPRRPEGLPDLMCGIRPDNLCVAYDSTDLPDTEEKWNRTVFLSKQHGCYKWPKTLKVCVTAAEPQLERGPLTDQELAIVAWFESKKNLERWMDLLLIEKSDEELVNDTTCTVIKYVLRNFPDQPKILENLKEQLAGLFKMKERQHLRLAAEIFLGIAKGTRHRPFKELDELWKWLAPEVDNLFNHVKSDAKKHWTIAIRSVLAGEDARRFHWLIEQLLVGMQRNHVSSFHQSVRADLIPATRWRDVETRNRINEIVWKQLPRALTERQRGAISSSLSFACSLTDANLLNDFSSVPERFRLKKPDVWIGRFLDKMNASPTTGEVLTSKSEMDLTTSSTSLSGQPPKRMDSEPQMTSRQLAERKTPIYLRTMLNFVVHYYDTSITCLTPALVRLFPLVINYANEDDSHDLHLLKDYDIGVISTTIVHEIMNNVLLTEKYADELLNTLVETYKLTSAWKVRVTVLKVIQVLVFANIYVCERKSRAQQMSDCIFAGLVDGQSEVRQESARCLQALTHFDFIKTDDALVQRVEAFRGQRGRRYAHGTVLGLGAIVQAHPYTLPRQVVPCLQYLCRVSLRYADLHAAATTALREFRRSHRDEWTKTREKLGGTLVYCIENALAPYYYA